MKTRKKMEVANPLGELAVKTVPVAPRLDTLNGKTICELSSNMYNAEISFPILRELLRVHRWSCRSAYPSEARWGQS